MNEALITNYNELVCNTDEVWFLGDLAMLNAGNVHKLETVINRLNGQKHLVLGNHDEYRPFTYVNMGFHTVHTAVKVEEFWLVHDPAPAGVYRDKQFLCGHVHQLFLRQGNALNVGVDVWDFRPVHIETIREFIKDETGS